jgi:hypothetical protein
MSISKTMDLINEIENEFAVDQWISNGMHVWPLLRQNIAHQIYNFLNRTDKSNKKDSRSVALVQSSYNQLNILISYLKAYLGDYQKNAKPERDCGAIFLSHSTCRSFPFNGKMYDIFCDPLISILENLNIKSLVLELAPEHEYRIPRFNSSIFIEPILLYLKIKSILLRRNKDHSSDLFNNYTRLMEYLGRKIKGFNSLQYSYIFGQIKYIRSTADYFKQLFSVVRPSMGFVVTFYSREGMAFNLACHEFGIPSLDIQHGAQGPLHFAYGRWHNLPAGGYELLPSYFLCWSEKEEREINEWGQKSSGRHIPVVLGNLYMDMFKDANNPITNYYALKIEDIKNSKKKDVHILMTLQPGYGLLDLYKDVISSSPLSWFWWIRLHPGMQKEKKRISRELMDLHTNNYNIEEASGLPLYAILPNVDVHVTQWSSTVIEAMQFGIPSVVTHSNGRKYFPDIVASGFAVLAFTKADLIDKISDQVTRKKSNRFGITSKYLGRIKRFPSIKSFFEDLELTHDQRIISNK